MAATEVIMGVPYDFFQTGNSAAPGQLDVTVAAPTDTEAQHVVQGVEFSANAAPAASIAVQLIEDLAGAATVKATWQVPASAIGPQVFRFKGILIAKGKSVTLRVPSLGGTGTSSGQIMGMTRTAR